MKFDASVKRELLKMAIGQLAVAALICLIWLLMGSFAPKVLYGALYGAAVAWLYFLSICTGVYRMTASIPTDEEAQSQAQKAKRGYQGTYLLRMLLVALALVVAFKSPYLANLPAAIPFFLVRPIATLKNPFESKEETKK